MPPSSPKAASRSSLASLAALVLLMTIGTASAKPRHYRIDPVHTRVMFRVDHAGLSKAMGSVSGITGELRFDRDDPTKSELDVRIPLATLELGDARWREAVLDNTFLDAGTFPEARFVAQRVEAGADGRLQVHGELSLRGVSRALVLDARLNAVKRHPLTLKRSIGFSATARLRRSDFGMDAWRRVVGDTVELLIEVEAQRTRSPSTPQLERADADPQ